MDSARAYARERAPVILRALGGDLRAVERRFQLRLSGVNQAGRPAACEWAISGYLDLEAADEVRDFKLVGSSIRPRRRPMPRCRAGCTCWRAPPKASRPRGSCWTRRAASTAARSRTPRFAEVETTRSQDALVALQRRVAATTLAVALYAASGSWPYAPAAWWCAEGQCHAWAGCAGGGLAAGSAPAAVDGAERRAAA